jgi:hypothetical protein
MRIEIGNNTGKNRKMFSIDIQGGREWVWTPGKFFGPSCNGGSVKRILHDNYFDVPKK